MWLNLTYNIDIKDVITTGLTIWGLVIATKGLVTWRKQIKGTKEFDVAYNLNYSVLKLRDAIKHVRNPAIWPSESMKAEQYYKEKYPDSSEDIKKISNAVVYEMRWDKISAAYTEMESHLLAAEVLWGTDILKLIRPLNKKVNELNIGLKQYFRPEWKTKDYEALDNLIYDTSHEDNKDPFSKEVEAIIESISNYLKPKIG